MHAGIKRMLVRFGLLIGLSSGLSAAHAAELKLLAANALREPLLALVPEFEQRTGHRVALMGGGTEGIAKRVGDGEVVVDVVLIASENIDRLIASGRLAPGSRTDFARTSVAMALRTGLARPDVSTAEGVKRAILDAGSIAYSTGPSGFHVAALLAKWGIADTVKPKIRQPPSGTQIGEMVARGDVDLGFQQVSELAHVKGLQYLGPLPADIQRITVYAMGLHAASSSPDAARALMTFLSGPDAAPALARAALDRP
jgi:molybdate transport system substrate-binding protein